jgi:RHS repeat-associated protein
MAKGDGVRNGNEPLQTNWTVYLDANQNNRLDTGEKSTQSNSYGDYSLAQVTPGPYSLAIAMQSGWAPTLPASQRYQGTILANQTIGNLIFGNTTRGSNNNPPDFTSSPVTSAIQGKRYRYTPTAIDADGDSLTFSLDYAPTGMVIDPASGTLSWFVDTNMSESRVTLKVEDGQGGSDLQSFTLVIKPNELPEFISSPILKAVVGNPYGYDANAIDADDLTDSLRFKLDSASVERGMTIQSASGLIEWANPFLGLYPIAITVTDPYGAESIQRYDLAVNASDVNRPPQILSNPSGQIERGKTFVHSIAAFDPDNDPISFGIVGPPLGMTLDASGTLRWTPTLVQLGTTIFTLAASDGSLTRTRNVTLTVANHPSNDAPQFTTQPPAGGLVGKSYIYDANAFDPEGDTLRFELLSSPDGMTIDARSGIVDWKPNANQAGFHPIRLRVSDMRGGSAIQSDTIDVGLVNRPPVISSSPVTSSPINKPYHYPVRVSDADGDAVRFRLGNQTTAVGIDLEIDSNTGLLSWTPKSLGTYTLEVIATDIHGLQAIQTFEMTVVDSNANQPPQITSTPPLTAEVGVQYAYDLHAIDPDSSLLTYRLITPTSIPPNASFDPTTGLLLWTPTVDQLHQSVPHAIQVSDGQWTATQSFEIKVVPANSPPILRPLADVTVVRGDKVLVDASASDADNDPIRFNLDAESIATGLTIDADRGRIAWQTFAQSTGSNPITPLGSRAVTVTASDGRQSVSRSFLLTTVADTAAPIVRMGATDASGKQVVSPRLDQEILLFVSAVDNVRIESRTLTLASVTRNGITTTRNEILTLDANYSARLRIQADMIGLLQFQGTASDPSGNIGTAIPLQLLVPDPDDLKPPMAQILGGPQLTLSQPTAIFANVSDESPLVTWRLELVDNTTRRLSMLAYGSGNLANAPIAILDTTMMRNGAYTLILTAIDSGANQTIDTASLQIEGGLKLGNFSLGFNDLTVPVAGVPIMLTRRYDSLDADVSGDFGYGWSLDIATTKIELQIDPNRLPDLSGYIPFRDGDRVLVTLPDGTQEGFTFYGKPGTAFLGIVLDYVPAFVADAGIKSKLLVDSLPLKKVGDDYLDYASGRLYNPADPTFGGSYELKLRNGSSLVINAKSGELTTLVDRVGNEVIIGPDGFQSASGRGIDFERDWANRITAVIDPRGKRIEYEYDGAGDLVAMTNRVGATTRFTYADNRAHFLQSIVDPLGRIAAATTYAPDGRFHSLANASGQSATAAYNVSAGTQSVTDANGFVSSQTLNARGNVTRTVDQTGVIATATFDSKGNVLSQTQVIGLEDATSNETDDLTTTYVYDSEFNLMESRDSFGNASRSTHDEYGAVTSSTDANGNTSRTNYNPDGTLAFTTDPDSNTSRFRANDTGNITQSRDRNNNLLFDAVYNSFGELTSMTPGEGLAQTIAYDDNGNSIASWSLEGSGPNQVQALRLSRYNDDNKVIASQMGRLPIGHHILANFETAQIPTQYLISSAQTEFDAIGQPTVAISDTGLRNETVLDIDGRIVETRTQQRASGSDNAINWFVSRTVYDAVGRTIAVTDSHLLGIDPALIEATRTEYDPAGRVTATYRVVGIQIELVGPLHSQQSRIASPGTVIANSRTTNVYDSSGRSYLSTDGYGRESRSTFNAQGQTVESRTQSTTETGQSVWLVSRTVFDSQGRPLVTTDQYMDIGLSMDSPPVEGTRTVYDSRGRSIGSQRLTGVMIRLTNNETSVVSMGTLISSTRTEYDSQGRAFRQIASDGQISESEYDSRGRVAATLGMHILASSVGLTARGDNHYVRLRSETRYNQLGQAFQTITGIAEYGSVVNGVFVKSALATDTDRSQQRISESIYDDAGRVVRTNMPDGTFTRTEYDSKGRVVAEIDSIGNRKDMSYDLDNRLAGVMLPAVPDPRNNNTLTRPTYRYEYNVFGQMSKLTDSNDHVTHFGFDATGRPTSRTLPDGQIETMAYDLQKRLVLQVSFEGVHQQTVYDDSKAGAGRVARREYFANANDYNAFVSSGNLDVMIQWKRVSMTYDAFGRVTNTTHSYASGAAAGVPMNVVQDVWTSMYDAQGRVIQEATPTGNIQYEYDALGRKTVSRAVVSSVPGTASEVTYTYDPLGRLKTVNTTIRDGLPVDSNTALAGDQPETTTHYYDLLGRMDFRELPNSVVEDYTFDNMDRLDVMRHYLSDTNNTNLADNILRDMFDYSYRADGKRTGLSESFGGSGIGFQPVNPALTTNYTWTYDNAGRLISEVLDSSDNSLDQTESYITDLAGNRMRRMIDKPNATNDATDIYTFDSSDRILSEDRYAGLSPTGVPTGSSIGSTAYQWNGTQQASKQVSGIGVSPVVSQNMSYGLTGQLEKVVTTTSSSGNVTARTQVEYRYDMHGIRFIATDYAFDPQTSNFQLQTSTEYLIDQSNFTGYAQTILETVKNAAGQTTKRTSYTFGMDEITQTVSDIDPNLQLITQSSTLAFGHDGHGSTRVLYGAAAAIAQVFTYSAYGELLAIHNNAGANLTSQASPLTSVLYNGESIDSRTGLYNFRARWYSASNGRFERLDPYAGNPNDPFSFNKYGFTHGDPVLNKDPTGKYLIAIDGTGTEDWLENPRNPRKLANGRWLSHVRNFYDEYQAPETEKHYDFGPRNGTTASDLPQIEDKAFNALEDFFKKNPSRINEPIDIIGWSRGAYSAMRLAEKLKNGLTFRALPATLNVRFLGLYDPVDMTLFDPSGAWGTHDFISSNVQNVVWAHGVEDSTGSMRDYDEESAFYYNWPRIQTRWGGTTRMTNLALEATHGAIGGTPGYSPSEPENYNYSYDIQMSVKTDTAMRTIASGLGVPINVIASSSYGFPSTQSQLPAIRTRTWFGFVTENMVLTGGFSFGLGF